MLSGDQPVWKFRTPSTKDDDSSINVIRYIFKIQYTIILVGETISCIDTLMIYTIFAAASEIYSEITNQKLDDAIHCT